MNNEKRPKIKIPLTWKDKVIILIATGFIMFVVLYLKVIWNDIPQIIPTHFNFSGEPDSFGNKNSLFIIIGIAIGMHVLFAGLSKVPHCYNYPTQPTEKNAEALYKVGRQLMILMDLEISAMFSIIIWDNIQAALGKMHGMPAGSILVIIGVLFSTIIYEIIKMARVQGQ